MIARVAQAATVVGAVLLLTPELPRLAQLALALTALHTGLWVAQRVRGADTEQVTA